MSTLNVEMEISNETDSAMKHTDSRQSFMTSLLTFEQFLRFINLLLCMMQ